MQVCKNPVGKGHPIIGKFCPEDQNGALVCNRLVKERTQFEYYIHNLSSYPTWGSHTFTQKVYGVMVQSWNRFPATEFNYWCTPARRPIKVLPYWVHDWLPFEGETIWFSSKNDYTRGRVLVWGFY